MKCLIGAVVVLTVINFGSGQTGTIDFCSIDITNNLDGRAYPIDNVSEMVGIVFKEEFEYRIKTDEFKNKFLDTFGTSMNEVSSWYYDFDKIARINVDRILPESLHCLFVYEREFPPSRYWQSTLDTTTIINYLTNVVFDFASNEDLVNVRLPLIVFDYNNAVACNFGQMFSSGEEYFVLHCVHNIMDSNTKMTTKIMHKSSKIQMCNSDVVEACSGRLDIDIRAD